MKCMRLIDKTRQYKVASLLQYVPVTFLPGQRLLSSVPVASLHEVAPLLCAILSLHNHVHHLAFGLVVHSV